MNQIPQAVIFLGGAGPWGPQEAQIVCSLALSDEALWDIANKIVEEGNYGTESPDVSIARYAPVNVPEPS